MALWEKVRREGNWKKRKLTATTIYLYVRNLSPWILRIFSLRKYPSNTRNRACEWLRFLDGLEHAQIARAITKKRHLKRSNLCKLRYLRNVNSRRNGTCKEDNIVYTYMYTPLILLSSSIEHLRDLLLLFLSTIIFSFYSCVA